MYIGTRGLLGLLILGSLLLNSGCAQLQAAAYKSAEAAEAYCGSNTVTGRELVREGLEPAYEEKDMAICLRCPGEEKTYCTGDPKTVVSQ